jgi:hypothetical protein
LACVIIQKVRIGTGAGENPLVRCCAYHVQEPLVDERLSLEIEG